MVAFKYKLALCTHIPRAEKQSSAAPDTGLSFYVCCGPHPLVVGLGRLCPARFSFLRLANRLPIMICEPNTHMPRVKGSGATCSAFSAEPKCKGCINKRPCHRRPANRLADCSCGYCGNLSMQVPVEVDKGEGQLEKPSTRCSRRQMKPNVIVPPTITAEKGPTYQTAAAQEAARRRRKKRQARYQNNKKSEGTQPQYTSPVLG